jgi:hypothetical protein
MSSNCPAVIVITASNGAAYAVSSIRSRGNGYKVGNSFFVKGTFLGGLSPQNDMTLSVASLVTTNLYGSINTFATPVGTGGPASSGTYTITLDFNNNQTFQRDSSDTTRALRERLIYNEKRAGSNIVPNTPGMGRGNTETLWQIQGNNFRLAYLFGKLKCGAGFGGAFNLNGPNSFSSPGVQSGS